MGRIALQVLRLKTISPRDLCTVLVLAGLFLQTTNCVVKLPIFVSCSFTNLFFIKHDAYYVWWFVRLMLLTLFARLSVQKVVAISVLLPVTMWSFKESCLVLHWSLGICLIMLHSITLSQAFVCPFSVAEFINHGILYEPMMCFWTVIFWNYSFFTFPLPYLRLCFLYMKNFVVRKMKTNCSNHFMAWFLGHASC